jgi:hypothetical protein
MILNKMIDLPVVRLTTSTSFCKKKTLSTGCDLLDKEMHDLYFDVDIANMFIVPDGLYTVQRVTNEFDDYELNLVPYSTTNKE